MLPDYGDRSKRKLDYMFYVYMLIINFVIILNEL